MLDFLHRRWHRLRASRPVLRASLAPPSFRTPDDLTREILQTRGELERLLRENIIPFWTVRAVVPDGRGYEINHDARGEWKGPGSRHTVPQARTCWFFSRMAREGGDSEALGLASHGYELLHDSLWDAEEGGFFWEVDSTGESVVDGGKMLYAQSFGLYAAVEFARASGDPGAVAFARRIASLIEDRYRDEERGGYFSEFDRAWKPLSSGHRRAHRSRLKSVDDHLHVLEAYTSYQGLSYDEAIGSRLMELILILSGTTLRKTSGACTNLHRRDWTPVLDRGSATVSYGHAAETAWLVGGACRAEGVPFELVADFCRTLLDNLVRWGRDSRKGGIFFAGPLGGPAHDRRKVFWVQAETLVAALSAYRLTGDAPYGHLYLEVLGWIVDHQVDWERGGWHHTIAPDGGITGDKAYIWKSPYHTGRAVMECLELLVPEPVPPAP